MVAKTSEQRLYAYEPDYAVPPGETLRETLETLGMSQVELAERSGLSTKHVNQVLQGAASLSPETALLLERTTGVPARLWNRLEANYQEQRLRLKDRKRFVKNLDWLKRLPVAELIRRGAIGRTADPGAQVEEICRFFGVADRTAWERVWLAPQASFRISRSYEVNREALASWLRLGELRAGQIQCQPFDRDRFRKALSEIRTLTSEPPQVFEPQMTELCAGSGVALVIEPEIRGARVSGAVRWLTPSKALIQLSLRYRWEDQFWFSFFHEAGHILRHGKKETFVHTGNDSDELEDDANFFAQTFLIPREKESQLLGLELHEIPEFAAQLGISPGIVVGRLQRERRRYDWGNHLRRRFRFVSESDE